MSNQTFIPPFLERYCEGNTSSHPQYLQKLIEETKSMSSAWNMLSGQYQGRLLSLLSRVKQPKRILEIGTYTGFSALCLAEGLKEDGYLITVDISDQYQSLAKKYVEISGFQSQIHLVVEKAENYIRTIDEPIDLVFIDAAKKQYSLYLDLLKSKLSLGALVIADNVLWKGMVVDRHSQDERAKALDSFNQKITQDPHFCNILLPIRDGLMLGTKVS